jgi:hypothetical protein
MEVRIEENQYGKCGANDRLVYPAVNSCLTVTALFGDGSRTGAHLTETGGWRTVLDTWKEKTKEKQEKTKHMGISKVFVLGDFGWQEDDMATIWKAIAELGGQFDASELNAPLVQKIIHGDISVDNQGNVTD